MERTKEDIKASLQQDIEALKSQALEGAPVALTLIDLQGKRLWANKAFCQLLGKPPEALLGVSVELATPTKNKSGSSGRLSKRRSKMTVSRTSRLGSRGTAKKSMFKSIPL